MAAPDQVINSFFRSLQGYQFPVCWHMLSNKSQQAFLQWTLKEIYRRHENAAKTSKMGLPEIKFMFENNDQSLIQIFWRRFVHKCNAGDFCQYGYFSTLEVNGNQAMVQVDFKYPNGDVKQFAVTMVNERGGWKFGYLESGFKID